MSARTRVWLLLGLAFVLLIASGVAYVQPNTLVFTGAPAVAEVVSSQQGDPSTLTVRFTTADGQQVETTTSKLYGLPPAGAAVAIRYDADNPTDVAAREYRESSLLSTLLVIAFTVTFGAAVVTWRRQPRSPA